MSNEFQIGDIVEAFGVRGSVVIPENDYVKVEFNDVGFVNFFYPDGRYCEWHKEPSLKLIERPKKMVRKEVDVKLSHINSLVILSCPEIEKLVGKKISNAKLIYEVEE